MNKLLPNFLVFYPLSPQTRGSKIGKEVCMKANVRLFELLKRGENNKKRISYFSFLLAIKATESEAKETTDTELMGMRMAAKMGVSSP